MEWDGGNVTKAGTEYVMFKTFVSLIYFIENELLFRCFCHAFGS